MIKIQATINKTLVPMNFIKGLAILYTFVVVVGMVGILESQALFAYFTIEASRTNNGWDAVSAGVATGIGYFAKWLLDKCPGTKVPEYVKLCKLVFYFARWSPYFWLSVGIAMA